MHTLYLPSPVGSPAPMSHPCVPVPSPSPAANSPSSSLSPCSGQWWGWVALCATTAQCWWQGRLCLLPLVPGRDVKGSMESWTGNRRELVDCVGSSSETGDVEVTLAPGEGKRKVINSCDAQLSAPRGTPEKGLCIGSYWPKPPPRLQG